jgi:hypothetical protein
MNFSLKSFLFGFKASGNLFIFLELLKELLKLLQLLVLSLEFELEVLVATLELVYLALIVVFFLL